MISIKDDIIQYFKEHSFTYPPLDIRDTYADKKPVFPMITVDEVINNTFQSVHRKEIYSNIGYKVECYAKDNAIGEEIISKSQIAVKTGFEIDKIMMEHFGFIRVGNPTILTMVDDNTAIRYIVTYSGIIHDETKMIYQL